MLTKNERADRRAAIVELARFDTLQNVGDAFGISRERVRQIVELDAPDSRNGRHGRWIDPIQIVRAARAQGVTSIARVARTVITSDRAQVLLALKELGLWPAIERLWRMRRRAGMQLRHEEMLRQLAAFAEELGHTPGMREIVRAPRSKLRDNMAYVKAFGSIREAQRLAGLVPRASGAPGHLYKGKAGFCKRGHERVPENLYGGTKCKACNRMRRDGRRLFDEGRRLGAEGK